MDQGASGFATLEPVWVDCLVHSDLPTFPTSFSISIDGGRRVPYRAFSFTAPVPYERETPVPIYWAVGKVGKRDVLLPLLATERGQISTVRTPGKAMKACGNRISTVHGRWRWESVGLVSVPRPRKGLFNHSAFVLLGGRSTRHSSFSAVEVSRLNFHC